MVGFLRHGHIHVHVSVQPSEDYKDLVCYYFNNKRNPRLILRPAKLEVVFLKPKIYIFRGIIYDEEMDRLKELAGPKVS